MDGKVSFTLTDTHGDENPTYNLSVSLEGFDSPDSLLAGLDRLREIIEVRYQRKFPIHITIENNEEALVRLEALREMVSGHGRSPDVEDLHFQIENAIAVVEAQPAHREQKGQSVRLFTRKPDHPLANPHDEPSRFPHVNQDDPNKPGTGDQF